ncbi:type IV secretion protein Rhs [Rathayibacter tritici]|uniref:DUF6531 domain-containing protein n=1 Tax=Rathayibacter tritici TaxID=33888 RepID=UPI000CE8F254|nr:DUF6531 domain-containing protein [Rathayibacter tritici]PPF62151.1 type IV secretion protein Rhs [Rathayibacter tritici]
MSALAEFRGGFAELFRQNAQTAASDAARLREVAVAAGRLRDEAAKEQQRRVLAREWKREQDSRNLFEQVGAALFGEEDPPVGPAAEQVSIPIEQGAVGARQTPAPGGGGMGGGTSSARPEDLRAFADASSSANDELRERPGKLRGLLTDFADQCRWGSLDADGVVSGFVSWLAANDQDVVWARSVAEAFAAAGGEGVVSTLADSALALALGSAGVALSREDITITPAQAYGAPPTSGFADDPVNTGTGNFLETEVDLGFPGGAGSLRWERTYNSLDERTGAFGPGWSSVAQVRLRVEDDGATLVLPDGREVLFPRQGEGWDRAVGENRWLSRESGPEGDRLVVSGNDRSRWLFTAGGQWLSAASGPGTRVDVAYDEDGALTRLVHERGRWVALEWSGGRIVVAHASDGRRVEYVYDAGRLIAAAGPGGTRRYGWNADGLIESVTDAGGVVEVRNRYDAKRRVLAQTSPFGRTTRYAYLPGRASVVSDTDGSRSNTWISDARGRLVGIIDPAGRRQSMSYDAAGNLLSATGRDGTVTAHAYDARGRLVRTKTPSGADIIRGYDQFDRVTTVVAEQGGITRYEYATDEDRSPSVVIDPEGGRTRLTWNAGLLIEVTDPEGVSVRLGYDPFGDLVTTTDADGNTARLLRDQAGRVVAAVSPSGARTEYRYTPAGLLASRRDPLGATWRYTYGAGGRLTAIVDPLGARTIMEHGEHGAVTRTIDPLGRAIAREFDDLGNVSAALLPDGTSWRFAYDALSRLTETTDPAGHLWRREYDADGALSALIDPTGSRATVFTDPNTTAVTDGAASSRTRFDPLGRPVATEAHDGSTALTVYDRCGRPVELVDEEGGLNRLIRDAAGRVIAQVAPSGASTRFEYDRCGRLATLTDPAGAATTLEYDADGRQIRWTGPTGETGWSEYDAAGRVTARHTPGRGTARYRYDPLGRVVWSRDSWHGTRRFRYDPAGQLIEAVNGVGGVTRYEYDDRGRNTVIIDPLGGITRRTFDAADHAIAATDPLGRTTTAGYDPAGRQLWQQDPDGHRLSWTYDTAGRETSLTADGRLLSETRRDLPARQAVITDHTGPGAPIEHTLAWNRRDQLLRRTRDGQGLAWEYDADGHRTAVTGPDGTRTRYERDSTGRVTAIEHPSVGRASFEYDAAGHLIASTAGGIAQTWRHRDGFITEHSTETGAGTGSALTRVTRDEDGRITRLDAPTGGVEYRYDNAQQLLETRTDAGTSTFEYDTGGRLTRETHPDGRTSTHDYDAAGQLLATTREDGTRIEYLYDGLGRRTRVTDSDGHHRSYAWSATGWLDAVTDGTSTTTLHVDTLGELASINGIDTWWDTASYAPALLAVGDTPILATPGGVTGIGDTWTGAGWRADRPTSADDPWGTAAPDTLPPGITLPAGIGLTGSGGLSIAGLEWLGHRAYDPASRGFLTVDPLDAITGAGWSGNPYSYAGNDPLHAMDPTGLRPVTDADLRAYRDGNNGAFAAASDWWSNNWEYVAAGALVAIGVALMFTGVGTLAGAALVGAASGAFLAGGISVATQKATTGSVDWGQVGIDSAVGALGGGAGGAAEALAYRAGASAFKAEIIAGTADGGVSGAAQYLTSPGPHTPDGLLGATAAGAAGGAASGLGGPATRRRGTDIPTTRLDDLPLTPVRPRLTGTALVAKGQRGVQASIEALQARGDTLVETEITLIVDGVRTRVDILAMTPSGELYFIEAKNGRHAKLTKNQEFAYPLIEAGGSAIPVGRKAEGSGLELGKPLGAMTVRVDPWDIG